MTQPDEPASILVIDDDEAVVALVRKRLQAEGFRTAGAGSGAEAVEWLAAHHADLMVLDLRLPDMSGHELLRRLAERGLTLPFIVITGYGDERIAVDVMKQGARDYLLKDGNLADLLPSVVNRAIEEIERQRRLTAAEESLRESQRMLATLMSNLPGMAYRCHNDADWTMEFVSEGCLSLTGYHPADLIGNARISYAAIIHPDDRRQVYDEIQAALGAGRPFRIVYRIRTADGEEKWVWEQGRGVDLSQGNGGMLEGFITDITERRRAEEALRESEQRLREVAENIQEVFWVVNPGQGQVIYVSPAYEKVFGRSPDALYADPRSALEAVHPADRERMKALMHGGPTAFRDEEFRIVRPDGSVRWIVASMFPVANERGEVYRVVGVAHDITDRKSTEEQLRHSQKLEAIGTLASGVAHDFNNLLTAILGYTSLARKSLDEGHPAHQALLTIDRVVQQAGGVAKALLTFSHKTVTEKSPVNLPRVVADAVRLLRRVLPASIEIADEVPVESDIWVNADPTQIQQVLMNLAVNARDAMPDGGTLRITLCQAASAPSQARPEGGERAPRAILTVEDTGHGMAEEVRSRVFEPFFTTKARGQGTGLGMSIVHGIVTEHHGEIRLQSEEGRGTRVTISLPTCKPPPPPADAAKARRERGHGEAVLIVEDDEHIRSILTSMLRSEGYQVFQAGDGIEALNALERHASVVRLLVIDVDLPRLGGLDFLRQVRQMGRDLPAVVVTGSVAVDDAFPLVGNTRLLRKPFRMADLATALAQMLAESPVKEVVSHEQHDPSVGGG